MISFQRGTIDEKQLGYVLLAKSPRFFIKNCCLDPDCFLIKREKMRNLQANTFLEGFFELQFPSKPLPFPIVGDLHKGVE